MKPINSKMSEIIQKVFLLIWFAAAVFISALLLYASWQHNPQSEFHEKDIIHWGEWLPIGINFFILSGGPVPLIWFIKSFFVKKTK